MVLGAEDGMMQSAPMHVQRLCVVTCVCRKHAVRRHMFVGSANNDYELTRTTKYILNVKHTCIALFGNPLRHHNVTDLIRLESTM